LVFFRVFCHFCFFLLHTLTYSRTSLSPLYKQKKIFLLIYLRPLLDATISGLQRVSFPTSNSHDLIYSKLGTFRVNSGLRVSA
jgi:hypothetical protein